VIPAQYRVIVTHRPKLACRACERIEQAPAPEPSLDKNRVLALAIAPKRSSRTVSSSVSRHLIGPPGTGKTHLSLALGVEAVKAGRSVYFSSLADIVASLAKAERDGALRERIRYYCRFALLIVDEIGYLPVIPGGAICSSNSSTLVTRKAP
jgi:hypothetical protein